MAEKDVKITLKSHPLSREENGVTFSVKDGSSRFGELTVSKGGLRWKPKGKQKTHFADWHDLDEYMRDRKKK